MDFSQWEQRTGSDNSNVVSDLSDFSDLPGPSNTNMLASPQTFYSAYTSPGYHLFQAPYAQMPYGQSWPTTSVPLSNYSSLNGATSTSNSQTQAQPQPQHSPQQQHMSIDPMLSMNGAATSSMQSPFPPPSTFSPAQQQQQQPQPQQHPHPPSQQQQQQQMQAHPLPSQAQTQTQSRSAYFNPHIMYNSYYHQQTSSAPQGTLSPQALHSPTASIMSIMPTAAFYSQSLPQAHIAASASSPVASSSQNVQQYINAPPTVTQPSSTPTPEEREERKREFLTKIRPLLQSSAFTGAGAVRELTDRIAEYGISEVDAATRLEIVAAIRDGAGNHYFRAWSENTTAIDITREWIKAAAKGNNPPLIETTMPLLHLIDRLPFDLHSLMDSKLGKIIKKLVKDESSSAIRDLASNLERKWRNLLAVATEGAPSAQENNRTDDPSKKKRKLEPASSGTKAVPLKKAAVGTSASVKPVSVKKEPIVSKVPAVTVKDAAKADSSFFSAPKSKVKKLPSFTKKPPPTAAGQRRDDGVAQPSAINPFEEALKSMKVARKDSPAAPTPPPMGSAGPSTSSSGPSDAVTPLRRKKSVTWAPDDRLESVRFIERAIYDDDPADGTHVTHSLRDLDRGEGAALHAHLFEEAIDWAEPFLVELPQEPDGHQRLVRGIDSQEKSTQEEREKTALSAVYMSLNQIPESPAEPATVLTEEESDRELKHMSVGADLDALFQWTTEPVPAPPPAVSATVAELVGQLAMGSLMDTSGPGVPSNLPSQLDVNGAASAQLAAVQGLLPKEQLQQLLAQLSTSVAAAASGASVPNAYAQPTYDGWAPDYGVTYPDGDQQRGWSVDGRGRGRGGFRGGRGRGRGEDGGYRPYSKRKPCSFYAAGRCKYGDQCDFAHDMLAPMEQ